MTQRGEGRGGEEAEIREEHRVVRFLTATEWEFPGMVSALNVPRHYVVLSRFVHRMTIRLSSRPSYLQVQSGEAPSQAYYYYGWLTIARQYLALEWWVIRAEVYGLGVPLESPSPLTLALMDGFGEFYSNVLPERGEESLRAMAGVCWDVFAEVCREVTQLSQRFGIK